MIEVILSMNIYVSRRTDELIPLPNVNIWELGTILKLYHYVLLAAFVIWTFGILL